ncbi:DHA2 family efflux MFS transporter permease subunit [Pedobacter sp. MC2016-24]|uniref:DHA2 family efflux MFS transporter permease subunit n=1 Tax=Pedobacter sp. MC2016-24 TaxID=2780090 RepID=UPI0018822071|nr:DHA2 family efflux MFS transporter permease subunit [Pedobacter sp. MC2016-24]MBE9601586.1 DHA2 family efflux MFS transporter permease subunit [Pedobacter sp. MC2016-24]
MHDNNQSLEAVQQPTFETGVRKWLITITVITCALMELIDASIVNVATRQIAGNLGATIEETAWVVTAYAISNVVIIPMTGFLSDLFGRKRYFTASIIIFTVSSLLCGTSGSIEMLIFWRFVQGIGGGALLATAQTVLVETFPPEELDKANGIFGAGIVIGPTLGPLLGGFLTDNLSWNWIFYINIPIGIVAAFMSWKYIKGTPVKLPGKIDWLGIGALVVGVGGLQMILEEGERKDWFASNFITSFFTLTIVGLVIFIWRELTTKNPAVDLRVLGNRNVAIGSILRFVFGMSIFVSIFLYPVFVQGFLGWNATRTGLLILPGAFLTGMLMGVNGALVKKGINPKFLLIFGFSAVIAFSYFFYKHTTLAAGEWDLLWPQIIRGLGFGFIFVPAASLTLTGLKGRSIGQASGLSNMLQLLGGSVGIALVNTYVVRRMAVHRIELMDNLSLYNPQSMERMNGLINQYQGDGKSYTQAYEMAMATMNGTLNVQSAVVSYGEGFLLIGVMCAVVIPLIFFARIKKGESIVVDSAH